MKRDFLCILAAATAISAAAQTDSTRTQALHEAVVSNVRAATDAPFSVSEVKRDALQRFAASGRELPFLMQTTPSVVASSDNGLGIGTGYLRIRGSADARINFTLDGIPLNDPEDQCIFWANMNSYAAGLQSMQIQRGVGTSTSGGGGAFGASVALQSEAPSPTPCGEATASYGSYNTFHTTIKASTGLLWNHLIVDGRYSLTGTDGFVRHTDSRSGSYYAGAAWYGRDFVVRYKMFGNFEKCGQSWDGTTDDSYAWRTGDRRFNSLHEYYDEEGRLHTYPFPTTDNYWHHRHILSAVATLSPWATLTASAYYVKGHGYYSNFKPDAKLSKFGIVSPDLSRTDFVREKGLNNDVFGGLAHITWKRGAWDIVGGATAQNFAGNHYGRLVYAKNLALKLPYSYYDSDAHKFESTVFAKATLHFARHWSAFGDMQYRFVHYTTDGLNDVFIKTNDGYENQRLDVDERFNFWNPKAGLSYRKGAHHAYASFGLTHREPVRNNYTDQGSRPFPRHETLRDYEAGYEYRPDLFRVGANFFYMDYDDQLVQTGELSDIGEALTSNVEKSFRTGVEFTAGIDFCRFLSLEGHATLSRNRIKDFDEVVEDWDAPTGYTTVHHNHTTLSFSPSVTAGAVLDFHLRGLHAAWQTTYVGRQYIDNSESRARSLDAYSVSRLTASYTLPCKRFCGLRETVFGVSVDNVFNKKYVANAWTYSALSASSGYTARDRYTQNGYFPMAGTTVMGTVSLRF